jgi:hypothetical protein
MEALADPSSGLIPKYICKLNQCRLYLRVFFISDIMMLKGDALARWAISGTRSMT